MKKEKTLHTMSVISVDSDHGELKQVQLIVNCFEVSIALLC